MRSTKSAAVLLLGILMVFAVLDLTRSRAATKSSTPTVVYLKKSPRWFTYKVNPKPKGYAPGDNLLRLLDLVEEERGPDSPVVVLVDPHISFAEISDFDGVAGKAQLTNVHYFAFNPETRFMAELKWGPTVPYSTNPSLR